MPLDPIQVREAFHCSVLRFLAPSEGRALRVKGGVNLRFFYGSERYSEDMDLDADPRLRQRLKPLLRKVLHAPELRRELLALGIRDLLLPAEPAKDTETVLRYKLRLVAGGVAYPTKIEISYRGEAPASWAAMGRPLPAIVKPYLPIGIPYPEVGHYTRTPAVSQKIAALALRTEVQARDVFDLEILLNPSLDARLPAVDVATLREHLTNQVLHEAASRALEISLDEFRDQVAEFLPRDRRQYHTTRWETVQVRVASFIEEIERHSTAPNTEHGNRQP